jgi:hypothetical protein
MKEFTLLYFLKQTYNFVPSKEISEESILFTNFKVNIFNHLNNISGRVINVSVNQT